MKLIGNKSQREITNARCSNVEPKPACGDQPIKPKYELVEQGLFDIGEHTIASTTEQAPKRPRQLSVRVFVDKAKSAADINLDVSTSVLKISPSSKCMYELEVKLPYPVNSKQGNARFDAKKKTLAVTLPVAAISSL